MFYLLFYKKHECINGKMCTRNDKINKCIIEKMCTITDKILR